MHTKIMIAATVAALSLATTAFAGEGGEFLANSQAPVITQFDNTVLPPLGSEGSVESANAVPAGAMNGTAQLMYAQSVNRWFALQADHRFAQRNSRLVRPNG